MLLKIDPRLGMVGKILSGEKVQTIRKRKIEAGTKLQIWAMWRGMKQGLYCPVCLRSSDGSFCECGYKNPPRPHPRKLIDAIALEPVKIDMTCHGSGIVEVIVNDGMHATILSAKEEIHPFAKLDGFKSNREFVEFFWKYLEHGKWAELWMNRWRTME